MRRIFRFFISYGLMNYPDLQIVTDRFLSLFGQSNEVLTAFFAPGRVNLIGEHIDYNGGQVLPFAISNGTTLLLRKNNLKAVRFASMNLPHTKTVSIQNHYVPDDIEWINYPLGCIEQLNLTNHNLSHGVDLLYYGNIPTGSGLSSSASIEVLTLFGLNNHFQFNLSLIQLALMAQKAENEFVNVSCGIMDQYAVTFGKKNNLIRLDCDIPSHSYVPISWPEYTFLIINTNKSRGLADSKYNERFNECALAKQKLSPFIQINNLCDLSLSSIDLVHEVLKKEPILLKRTLHAIEENQRVTNAVFAITDGNIDALGELMNYSHDSLRDNYEVTGYELDTLVEITRQQNGVKGARMTGAGFGGCTVNLVHRQALTQIRENVDRLYFAKIGVKPSFYSVYPSDGVRILSF